MKTALDYHKSRVMHQMHNSPYFQLSKKILENYKPNSSVYLCNLVDKHDYFSMRGMLFKDEWFFLNVELQSLQTGIGKYALLECQKFWKKKGIIKIRKRGLPARNFYQIQWEKLDALLDSLHYKSRDLEEKQNKEMEEVRQLKYELESKPQEVGKPNNRSLEKPTTGNWKTKRHNNNIYNKNKLKNNKYISYTLKRTKFAYKDTVKKSNSSTLDKNNTLQKEKLSKAERIIKYWNNINHQTITRHNNPNAKIYQSTVQMLNNMLQGRPIICKKNGFPHAKLTDFAQMYNIPPEVIKKPWKPIEIKKKLKQLASQQTQKTSLQALLWNGHPDPKKCFSQILYEESIEQLPSEYYELADQFFETLAVEPTRKDQIQAARHFEKISKERHLQNGQLKSECLDLFAWLKKHRHEKYTPTVYSVYDFAEKYDKIKGQKERENQPQNKNKYGLHTGTWEPEGNNIVTKL